MHVHGNRYLGQVSTVFQGKVATLSRSMAHTLSDTYAKNLCKWTVLVHLMIKNVVTCIFGTHNSVVDSCTLNSSSLFQCFYHAVLCIARTVLQQDVCPSVHPSVTCHYCVKTANHIIILFYCLVAISFQFFRTKPYGNILMGTPLMRTSNAVGVKYFRFLTNTWLYLGMIQDSAIVTMECEQETYPIFRMQWGGQCVPVEFKC